MRVSLISYVSSSSCLMKSPGIHSYISVSIWSTPCFLSLLLPASHKALLQSSPLSPLLNAFIAVGLLLRFPHCSSPNQHKALPGYVFCALWMQTHWGHNTIPNHVNRNIHSFSLVLIWVAILTRTNNIYSLGLNMLFHSGYVKWNQISWRF